MLEVHYNTSFTTRFFSEHTLLPFPVQIHWQAFFLDGTEVCTWLPDALASHATSSHIQPDVIRTSH